MKIGIDGRWVGRRVGLGNLSLNLIKSLSSIDSKNQYFVYISSKTDLKGLPQQKNFHYYLVPGPYPFAEQVLIAIRLLIDGVDLFHAALGTAPIFKTTKVIATIADVMFLLPHNQVPQRGSWYQKLGGWYRQIIVPTTARKSEWVVTISNTSKKDIEKYLGLKRRLTTIYLAAGKEFSVKKRRNLRLPKNYIFSLVGIDPRKNSTYLIESFRKAKLRIPLVLAGTLDENMRSNLESNIQFLGKVGKEDLLELYQRAKLFVYPSRYEGFGIPILEAMASGCPVLTTYGGANSEIAGNAAEVVENEKLSEVITTLANDPTKLHQLRNRGLKRAKDFSWDKTAQEYLNLYRKVSE